MAGRIIHSTQLLLVVACGAAVSDVGAVPVYSVTDLGDLRRATRMGTIQRRQRHQRRRANGRLVENAGGNR
jgi:hypothetical protein